MIAGTKALIEKGESTGKCLAGDAASGRDCGGGVDCAGKVARASASGSGKCQATGGRHCRNPGAEHRAKKSSLEHRHF